MSKKEIVVQIEIPDNSSSPTYHSEHQGKSHEQLIADEIQRKQEESGEDSRLYSDN